MNILAHEVTNARKLTLLLLLLMALGAACSQPATPTAAEPPATETAAPVAATAEEVEGPAAVAEARENPTPPTREGSRIMLPYRDEGAGVSLFHPPDWTAELDPSSGLLLLAPEAAAGFRDVSNAVIVAAPSSIVGQSIVAGEEALTEARAQVGLQFLLVNFAEPFVPGMTLGEEITIEEAGGKTVASVPYSGTSVQEIPVSGTLNLIVDEGQVAGALTLTTGGDILRELLAEIVGSIRLSAPAAIQ